MRWRTPSFVNKKSLASAPVTLINNLNVFSLESFFQLVPDELFRVSAHSENNLINSEIHSSHIIWTQFLTKFSLEHHHQVSCMICCCWTRLMLANCDNSIKSIPTTITIRMLVLSRTWRYINIIIVVHMWKNYIKIIPGLAAQPGQEWRVSWRKMSHSAQNMLPHCGHWYTLLSLTPENDWPHPEHRHLSAGTCALATSWEQSSSIT